MKLQPQELRIGNYFDYEQTTHVIEELHSDKIISTWIQSGADRYVHSYERATAIELTETWLEDLGFKNTAKDWDEPSECYHIYYYFKDRFFIDMRMHSVGEFSYEHRVNVKYVHQLQNLYYAITGTELTKL